MERERGKHTFSFDEVMGLANKASLTRTKESLTVAELKSLLTARTNANVITQAEVTKRIARELGDEPVQEAKPALLEWMNKVRDIANDIVAGRLKLGPRATPLVSYQDIDWLAYSFLEVYVQAEGLEIKEFQDDGVFEHFIKTILTNILTLAADVMSPANTNPYDENWRWVEIVLGLAAERKISPTEFITLGDVAINEINRGMFSKEEFISLTKRDMEKYVNADLLKKQFLEPLINMMAGENEVDEEDRRELESQLEAMVMPKLRERVEKNMVILNTILDEDVARIYGTE